MNGVRDAGRVSLIPELTEKADGWRNQREGVDQLLRCGCSSPMDKPSPFVFPLAM